MYSMLNAEMIRARHVDRTHEALLATHRRELRELRAQTPRRRWPARWLATMTAGLASSVARVTRRPTPSSV
jgi:hypothetical protein